MLIFVLYFPFCVLYWGGPCGAHVFEGFFEDEPVKSGKMKVENKVRDGRLPHEFALCSLQFWLLSGSLFHCVEPHPQKNVNR